MNTIVVKERKIVNIDIKQFEEDLEIVMTPKKIKKADIKELYSALNRMEGGNVVFESINDVAYIHRMRNAFKNYNPKNRNTCGYITIDHDEILYNKSDGDNILCTPLNYDYIRTHFHKMLKKFESKQVCDVFKYDKDYEKKRNIRYKVSVIKQSEQETINCLDQCIRVVITKKVVTFEECAKCCGWVIQMLPISQFDVRWKECTDVICKVFKEIYEDRGKYSDQDSKINLLAECGAKICGIEYWGFLSKLYSNADKNVIDEFWKKVEKQMKYIFEEQCNASYTGKRKKRGSAEKKEDLRPYLENLRDE